MGREPRPAGQARLRWQVLPLARTLGAHAAAWDELNRRRFGEHPLLSALFVDGLLRHFGSGREHLCVLRADDVIHAMCILEPRSRWMWTTFRPAQAQIGCLLLDDSRSLSGLVRSLPGWVTVVDLLCVDPLVSGHLEGPAPSFHRHHARTMGVRLHASADDYLASRAGKLRNNLRRYAKKVEAEALPLRYAVITDPAAVNEAVLRYAELESRGWKGASGTALSPESEQTVFYSGFLEAAARQQAASVHELWFGPAMAASRLAVRGPSMTVMLKTTYDEALAKLAPGRLLLAESLRDLHARGEGHSVEFYTDATADQLSWATDSRSIYDMRVYRRGPVGALVHTARAVRVLRRVRAEAEGVESLTVDAYRRSEDVPADVVALFQEFVPVRGVQAGAQWFALLQQHVFGNDDCTLFVLRHQGNPVAALPLRRNGSWAEALANYYSSSFEPPVSPWLKVHHLRYLLAHIRAHWPQVSSFSLGPMDPSSQPFLLLHEALEAEGLVALRYFRLVNWVWHRPQGMGWPEYLASRSGAVRSTVTRAARRFESRGGHVEVVTGDERLPAALDAYERVYARSWKRREPFPGFLRDLMTACARQGTLRLAIAWIEDQPVAAQFWTVVGRRAEIFKLAYDEDFKALSPGTVLTAHMMRRVIDDEGVSIVDYLSGNDRYKSDWMNHRSHMWGIVAHDPRRVRACLGLLRALPGSLLRVLGLARLRSRAFSLRLKDE